MPPSQHRPHTILNGELHAEQSTCIGAVRGAKVGREYQFLGRFMSNFPPLVLDLIYRYLSASAQLFLVSTSKNIYSEFNVPPCRKALVITCRCVTLTDICMDLVQVDVDPSPVRCFTDTDETLMKRCVQLVCVRLFTDPTEWPNGNDTERARRAADRMHRIAETLGMQPVVEAVSQWFFNHAKPELAYSSYSPSYSFSGEDLDEEEWPIDLS